MKHPLKETLDELWKDPAVNKAIGIGEERQLIIDMIEKLEEDIKYGKCSMPPREVCQFFLEEIRNENHRKNFD